MGRRAALFLNRELSWLEFNQRVLDEAMDGSVPLLERLGFLAITASNLDEFFMVRVGGLEILRSQGIRRKDVSGLTPAQQLSAIRSRVQRMVGDQYACLEQRILPGLEASGLRRISPDSLSEEQAEYLLRFFRDEVFSVITPVAARSAAEFPFLAGLGLNVAVRLKAAEGQTEQRYAVVAIPRNLRRFVNVPSGAGHAYVLLEDVVKMFARDLFPGIPVLEAVAFRITRNADLAVQENDAPDLVAQMEEVLEARKRSDCVRLEVEHPISRVLLSFLKVRLHALTEERIFEIPGPLSLSSFMALKDVEGFDSLKYEAWPPQPSPLVDLRNSIFEELALKDVLLCHPYDSFEPVLRLLQEAADDPHVLAVKQVLYRTSVNSPVIQALIRAAERGKAVTAFVELKARFDEARNIEWARTLERAGAQVIYGVKGLKTHAKVVIVVRREPQGIVRYLHFGTGNYNERTARLYSDISYMTRDPDLGADATAFFNAISGYSEPQRFRKIEMAPIGLHERIIELIDNEVERRRHGQDAMIMAKMNSLVESDVIEALYRASQAGVRVLLNVRGICCLKPGVKGVSENIRVLSIVDRFLEHSRVFYFRHGGEEKVFISSADWMPRNLLRRVELMVPVDDPESRRRLVEVLETCFADNVKSSRLRPDGSYVRTRPHGKQPALRSQEVLYERAAELVGQHRRAKRRIFEPHRAPEGSA